MKYIDAGDGRRIRETDDGVMMIVEPDDGNTPLENVPHKVDLAMGLLKNFVGAPISGKLSVGKLKEALKEFSDSDVIEISCIRKEIGPLTVSGLFLLEAETDDKRVLLAGIGEPA